MKNRVAALAAVSLAALSACGGNVIVDGAATGGATGTGGTGGTSGTSGTSSGIVTGPVSCADLPARSTLTLCGGGSSPQFACSFIYNCNNPAGSWEADCTGSACTCLHSGMVLCDCAFSSGDVCSTGVDCCFK